MEVDLSTDTLVREQPLYTNTLGEEGPLYTDSLGEEQPPSPSPSPTYCAGPHGGAAHYPQHFSPREALHYSPRAQFSPRAEYSPKDNVQFSPRDSVPYSPRDSVPYSPRDNAPYSPRESVDYLPSVEHIIPQFIGGLGQPQGDSELFLYPRRGPEVSTSCV